MALESLVKSPCLLVKYDVDIVFKEWLMVVSNGYLVGAWEHVCFPCIWGISTSELTLICQRGGSTTNQTCCSHTDILWIEEILHQFVVYSMYRISTIL